MTFRRRGDLMIQYLDFTKFAVYFMWPVLPCFLCFLTQNFTEITSVSETIRNLPLAKAQTAFKKNKIWQKNDFQYGGLNYYTLQSGTIMTLISPGYCTPQCGMWHAAQGSWHLINQVAAPCNVTRGSGIMTVNSPSGTTLQCDTLLWDDMPWNSPERPPYWNSTSGFDFDHTTAVDMSFCTSLRNFIQNLSRKNTSCRFSRWRISAILDFRGPIMGSLKSSCTTSLHVVNSDHISLLSFF